MPLLRSLLLLIIPGVLFVVSLYLHLQVRAPAVWQPLQALFPSLAVCAGLVLGWRFNRTRVLWPIVLLVLVERGTALLSPSPREYLLLLASVLVPINLALYSWWSERGLFTLHGLLRLMFLLLQLAGGAWLFTARAGDVMTALGQPLLHGSSLARLPMAQATLLAMLVGMGALLLRFWKKPEALEGSFLWVLAAVCAGFLWPESFAYWVGVAAFLLVVALIESSFKMAFNDELTGLPARRAMNEFLLKVGRRYTVAMVDVDHFKKVNDVHGHDVGDQVLRMVATCLRRVSGGGRAYRYGGEEFAVIFPNKDLERALPHLEELRETIARTGFTVRGRKRPKRKPEQSGRKNTGKGQLQVTVSIGAAERNDRHNTPQQLIKAADQALYRAKKGGRNKVCS